MNTDQVIDHFNRICDAPDAIPRLRRFILDLAVRGKLVEQDPNVEPVSELLKRIHQHKVQCESRRRDNNTKITFAAFEGPFRIPSSWMWIPFGDVMISRDGERIPVSQDERNRRAKTYEYYGASGVIDQIDSYLFDKPLLLIGEDGANLINRSTHIAFIARGKYWVNNHAHVLDGISENFLRYIQLHINAIDLKPYVTGTAQPKMNQAKMNSILIALPPEAEQDRIVAKVDELMALCDRLEAMQTERESRRDKLATASLHRLNNGAGAGVFREHALFHLHHLPRLTTRPEHIQQLRQTILNLAVRGRLVPQDPNDEPGSQLVKRIQMEKERLIREGLIRKEKPLSPVTEEDAPFSIPRSWSWVRIGTCALLTDYGTSVKSDHIDNGVPVLKMGDIRDGNVLMGGQKKVPPSIDDLPQLFLKRFDLLYNRTNSAELVGKTGIYLGEDDAYTFASYLIRIRFFNDRMSPVYCNLAMNASYFRATQIVPELQQQCGQANVNGTKLRNMVLPLPPAAEQHRIVAKIDELLAICDRLEAQLTGSQKESRCFLEAVLALSLE
jgi:type I restriction enzyme, S subunit